MYPLCKNNNVYHWNSKFKLGIATLVNWHIFAGILTENLDLDKDSKMTENLYL